MPELLTPADLARDLGVSAKRIREFLRATDGKLTPPATRWHLSDAQAVRVRTRFRADS